MMIEEAIESAVHQAYEWKRTHFVYMGEDTWEIDISPPSWSSRVYFVHGNGFVGQYDLKKIESQKYGTEECDNMIGEE